MPAKLDKRQYRRRVRQRPEKRPARKPRSVPAHVLVVVMSDPDHHPDNVRLIIEGPFPNGPDAIRALRDIVEHASFSTAMTQVVQVSSAGKFYDEVGGIRISLLK